MNWENAEVALVDQFRQEGSRHRPRTEARLVFDREKIYGQFRVRDQFVRCVHEGFNAPVFRDSCVEFFVQPNERGYFNFEFNCGGALLASFIRDPTRTDEGFKDFTLLPESDLRRVGIFHSLPPRVEPELATSTEWTLEFALPFALLEAYAGPVTTLDWRGNFYKCGDETSHPHWAAWSPVKARNFHLPECFGYFHFEA